MDWGDLPITIQNFFFGMLAQTAAGSAGVLFLLLVSQNSRWRNSRLKLLWIKTALLFYLLPITPFLVIGTRAGMGVSGIVWSSDFWIVSTQPMKKTYLFLGSLWFFGMVCGAVFRMVQYGKLQRIVRWNEPIANEKYQEIIDCYREKLHCPKVLVCQNENILFPICTGSLQPKVILPVRNYSEKELHMVLEHEMSHVRHRDLWWKKGALLVTLIHWWNPLSYVLLQKLILQEEIECDIRTCENNDHFTMKEYGLYLSGMPDNNDDMCFSSALCKSKKNLFRRLEGMVNGKKYKKRAAVVSVFCLWVMSMLPSYAAEEGVARFNERWMEETVIEREHFPIDYDSLETRGHVSDDETVAEIGPSEETEPISQLITLDYTLKAKTRKLYRWQNMKAGDAIAVIVNSADSSISYRIGMRGKSGAVDYVEGNGNMSHIFTIDSAGEYTVYVENRSSSKTLEVTGSAMYPN